MKHFYTFLLILISTTTFAQAPNGYYDSATGNGYALKTQLKEIINAVDDGLATEYQHQNQGDNIDPLYATSDIDDYYEDDGTILDIYSEKPTATDSYSYVYGSDECGNYNSEGDCYNKEHIIPQSAVNDASPMVYDAHHIVPTDGRVNGFRGNFPFGVVDNNQLVSQSGITNPTTNGSKLGGNLNSGYSAGYTGTVFEPIDEFKGDVARMYFYFVTRYEDQVSNWSDYDMFDGSNNKAIADPFLNILLTWHQNDPVSDRETVRNNAVFGYQNNRNPFVDHPEYAAIIWNTTPDTEAPTDPTNLVASNPTDISIDLAWTASTDNIAVSSYDIYVDGSNLFNTVNTSFTVTGLTADTEYCFTIKAKDPTGNESGFSNQDCETTTNNGVGVNCLAETFESIPANDGSYQTRNWTGDDGGNWIATDARTDQTITNRAITIRNGSLTTPSISGGIGSFNVTTKRVFGGTSGTFNLKVNGNIVGTIAYGEQDVVQNITIPNINIEDNVSIVIDGNSSSGNRVAFDDLSWTCYTDLNVIDYQLNDISIYPNPVLNTLNIQLKNSNDTQIEIYNILGKRVFNKTIQQSQSIKLDNLNSGVYILKLTQGNSTISKKLIKR